DDFAFAADGIRDVQLYEGSVGFVAQQIALDEDLAVAFLVAEVGKARITHNALVHHAVRQRNNLSGLGFSGQIGKLGFEVGRVSILRVLGDDKGVMAGGTQVGQLLAADGRLQIGRAHV